MGTANPSSAGDGPFKIIFDRDICIGALPCVAAAAEYWIKADDGKVDLKGATKTGENTYELVVDEIYNNKNINAAETCPVQAIKIIKLKTGETIV